MWKYQTLLYETILLFGLIPFTLGNFTDACNCTCSFQNETNDICELIQDVERKTDERITPLEVDVSERVTSLKSNLNDIIDERVRTHLNNLSKTQEKSEQSVEAILEFVCSIFPNIEGSSSPSGEKLRNICNKNFGFQNLSMQVSYTEIEELNATCVGRDSCELPRESDDLIKYNCHCGHFCSTLDTCCLDSPFRGQSKDGPVQSCRPPLIGDKGAYFMVNRCPENSVAGDNWRSICAGDGEKNNIMSLLPVTSLSTNVTYKNFYCFKCHETNDTKEAYLFWELKLWSTERLAVDENSNPILVFNYRNHMWMALEDTELRSVIVLFKVIVPDKISDIVKKCRLDVISSCHEDWRDDIIRKKCVQYTAIIALSNPSRMYKNPHCALCNFKFLKDVICTDIPGAICLSEDLCFRPLDYIPKRHLSITNFFHLTPSRICLDNFIWNPFSNECSPLTCSEGYILRDGNCVQN